jgi:H+/gluconate symporter-like permease
MIGLFGLVLSLVALMYFAYRGVNVLVLAPICAIFALLFQPELFAGDGMPLAYYTQTFMTALGKYLMKYFPIFLLGAIFGKLMSDSQAARVIGETISGKLGSKHAILASVLAASILTYGGVSLFVVAFCVYPISLSLFARAGIEKRFIPACIALGSFTFTMSTLPGTPAIPNAIPMPYFNTTAYAAPGLGIIGSIIILTCGVLWLKFRSNKTLSAVDEASIEVFEGKVPSFALAIAPLLIVMIGNFVFSEIVLNKWDGSYLAQAGFGATKLDSVKGLWAIILSLTIAIAFILIFMRKYNPDQTESVNKGTMGSLLPIFNTASEVGYGSVIASLASFAILRDLVMGISPGNPVVSIAVAINALAGITGSASGGLSIGLEVLGTRYMEMAQQLNINPELLHRVASMSSGGLDALPHNGAVISLLAICGLTHKQSYFDIFMVASFFTTLTTAIVVVLGSVFGSF